MTLNSGDIGFVQYNADGTDNFAFVALVDIPANETIFFTDSGWQSAGTLRNTEGTIEYTTPAGGLAADTVVTIDTTPSASVGTIVGESNDLNFSVNGDQILAYQGSAASPTFIAALNNQGSAVWQSDTSSSNDSALPSGLTNGTNAVAINEVDNVIYNGPTTGDRATLLAALNNASNWTGGSNTTPQIFSGSFTITGSTPDTTPPAIASLTPSDDATDVAIGADLEISFNENVQRGTGNLLLKLLSDDSVVETFDAASSSQLSISNGTVAIDPTSELLASTGYYVEIASGAIEDTSSNAFAGISGNSLWNFTTEAAAGPAIVINEILFDPPSGVDVSGDGTDNTSQDQFVEFVNVSGASLDISGWTLSDDVGVRHTFPSGTVLPADEAVVVFGGGGTPSGSFGNAIVQVASTNQLGLNNSGDTVTINDGTSNVASESYTSGGSDESLTRDPDLTGTFTGHIGATGSSGAAFSPGTQIDGSPFTSSTTPSLVFNELRISASAGDTTNNFVELFGAPGMSLDGLTLVVLSGEFAPGQVDFAIDLTGGSTDGDGFALIANSSTGASTDAGDVLVSPLDFFGSPSTFAIVENFTGSQGSDLDTNDDGTLDSMPWDSVIVDLSLIDGDTNPDFSYSSNIEGPDGNFPPAGLARTTDGTGAFQQLSFSDTSQDTPGASNSGGSSSSVPASIPEIQGSGATSPLEGATVTTTGVVVGDFQGSDELRGFFIQDPEGDSDPATSDGIFVFVPTANTTWFGFDVAVGDEVEVTGRVNEFNTFTELDFITDITINSSGNVIVPTTVTLPEATQGELEQNEGMLVEIASTMTVSQNFFLGRYGQLTLSSPDDGGTAGRLFQPTNVFDPLSPEATALAEENARRLLVLDDGQDVSGFGDNPFPVPYIGAPDTDGNPTNIIRAGDTVSNLEGVLDFGRINSSSSPVRDYRLHPTVAPVFTEANPRPIAPDPVGGSLKVGAFNVLNFFNGDGVGGGFPTSRGADTATELERQTDKIVDAIAGIDADILGLVEIENDGFGPTSAIASLVNAINAEVGAGTYTYVDPGTAQLGSDEIAVGFIYKPATVGIASGTSIAFLDTGEFDPVSAARHRVPLAVTFADLATNEEFTATVNHFKSKGSLTGIPQDIDQGDGQGNNNFSRTNAANELAAWLATDPTGSGDPDFAILGDLNAYAQEDPIAALETAGYTDVIEQFEGNKAYTFTFDGQAGYLDHALVSPSLLGQVTGATAWHINTDEAEVLDYDEEFNSQPYSAPDPYRSSDHDPVIVGLTLGSNEVPEIIPDAVNIPEGSPNLTPVITITATDVDDDPLSFNIIGGNDDADGDSNAPFGISSMGAIFVSDSDDLDYETQASYALDVEVSDGLATDVATITVNLLDLNETGIRSSGDDLIVGTDNKDRLRAKGGNDVIYGKGDRDVIFGGRGNDIVDGGAGRDRLFGRGGNDILLGGPGNDILIGGRGEDVLNGGEGRNRLRGGANADIFVVNPGAMDFIYGYVDGADRLGLPDGLTFGDLTVSKAANGATIALDTSPSDIFAKLLGVNSSDITQSDFVAI
ncbi:putative extracellular nuclease [Rubidibacter lacunae KORDI 51-2]|uniref:Putative extracellular nuclease n=1 Tax=Rubidibacter lacunae KORDI 51-2 TaxID=582515 RepID=U5DQX9_9CHRO|nr:ExeM/NucH family extracellular endonuclease [Rubidibacter lacunae]ERN43024.1 putative extracellular nuclease [Rubidibacter lacunae KORDI 51-2]